MGNREEQEKEDSGGSGIKGENRETAELGFTWGTCAELSVVLWNPIGFVILAPVLLLFSAQMTCLLGFSHSILVPFIRCSTFLEFSLSRNLHYISVFILTAFLHYGLRSWLQRSWLYYILPGLIDFKLFLFENRLFSHIKHPNHSFSPFTPSGSPHQIPSPPALLPLHLLSEKKCRPSRDNNQTRQNMIQQAKAKALFKAGQGNPYPSWWKWRYRIWCLPFWILVLT